MDTISRENNSMLPVGGIIVGVIALLLGGYSAITLSKVNRSLAELQPKVDKIDSLENSVTTASVSADKAGKDLMSLQRSMQSAFDQVGNELVSLRGGLTKLEEAAKKPVPAPTAAAGKKSNEPVVAGPGEYVVKAGDSFAKIARAHGVNQNDIAAVNPGVSSASLKIGQKIKLPAKK